MSLVTAHRRAAAAAAVVMLNCLGFRAAGSGISSVCPGARVTRLKAGQR
ncbi:MAG TPA: hypothetical protein VFJ07_04015 [Streptosporangiaceae bacterium]|nr:hypothetical protein [Streptosporangiaceae bacterium]